MATNQQVSTQPNDSIGVSLSGGGIRSASFQVGVLTALTNDAVFEHIDEISSVSGGGYTNASFYSHFRDRKGDKKDVAKAAMIDVKKQFEQNSNYLLTWTTPLLFIVSLTHNLVFWFSLCILLANFIFYGVTYKVVSGVTGHVQYYYNHIPLVSNSTVSVSGETDSFQAAVLEFFGLAMIPNDIIKGIYTSYGLHGLPLPVLIVIYSLVLLFFVGLLCLALVYSLKDSWGSATYEKLHGDDANHDTPKANATNISKTSAPNKEIEMETKNSISNGKQDNTQTTGGTQVLVTTNPEEGSSKTSNDDEPPSFWKELLFNIPVLILSFCVAVLIIFIAFVIFFEFLKIALFVEGLILKTWSQSSFTISHHIFNTIYVILWVVIGIISSVFLLTGISVLKTGTKIALASSGLFLMVAAPLMLLLILSHFCLWQIFGDDGQYSIIPFVDNTEKELYILKVFASFWLCLELFGSGVLNYSFKLLYSIGLTRFLSRNYWVYWADSKEPKLKFTFNTCVNNLKNSTIDHFSFSSDGTASSATNEDLPKIEIQNSSDFKKLGLTLSNVITLSGAAVSLHMGQVGHNRLLAFILYFLGINLGGWVDLDVRGLSRMWKWFAFFLNCFFLFGFLTINVFEEGIDSDFKQISWLLRVSAVFFIIAYCSLTVFFAFVKDDHCINAIIVRFVRYTFLEQIPIFRDLFLILGIKQDARYGSVFMSDGGHYENLGLLKLLKDGKKKIFSFDASQDNSLCLTDLYNCLEKAIASEIIDQDIEFVSNHANFSGQQDSPHVKYAIDKLLSFHEWVNVELNKDDPLLRYSQDNFIVVKVKYKAKPQPSQTEKENNKCLCRKRRKRHNSLGLSGDTATIWYGKATLTGNENGMIKLYQRQKHVFPHHSTMLQYFKKEDFLAYFELGKYTAECILNDYYLSENPTQNNDTGSNNNNNNILTTTQNNNPVSNNNNGTTTTTQNNDTDSNKRNDIVLIDMTVESTQNNEPVSKDEGEVNH